MSQHPCLMRPNEPQHQGAQHFDTQMTGSQLQYFVRNCFQCQKNLKSVGQMTTCHISRERRLPRQGKAHATQEAI